MNTKLLKTLDRTTQQDAVERPFYVNSGKSGSDSQSLRNGKIREQPEDLGVAVAGTRSGTSSIRPYRRRDVHGHVAAVTTTLAVVVAAAVVEVVDAAVAEVEVVLARASRAAVATRTNVTEISETTFDLRREKQPSPERE